MEDDCQYLFLNCACTDADHILRVYRDEDDFVGINVQMSHYLPLWRRLLVAAKYVCGGRNVRCHFTDTVLSVKDRQRLAEFIS